MTSPGIVHFQEASRQVFGGTRNLMNSRSPHESNSTNTDFHRIGFVAFSILKSTAMNRMLWLPPVLLVSVHRAEAQRPTNIPRIGYISGLSPAAEQGGSCDQRTFESVPASFLYVIPHCM